uniref:Gamma-tubulin complex component n=1 Tax=Cucumis melo TaxID=3656 RepID=A0A9I9D762_CUCME
MENPASTSISCPSTPRWNLERPFLTGRFHQEAKTTSRFAELKLDSFSNGGLEKAIGCYDAAIQELIVIDDLLSALLGIEGRYISIKRVHGKENEVSFQVEASMDLTLQELAKRIFPLCESFLFISQFVESRSQFKKGLVNHAFAAALRALLLVLLVKGSPLDFSEVLLDSIEVSLLIRSVQAQPITTIPCAGDYQAMVAQLEHQFRLGRLSIQGLWFYCQPMMGSMQALFAVTRQVSANDIAGSAVLNLLQSQAKAMAGDNAVRSLLEKMTQCASNAYLGILERWVYEGVIDDPYGEFFIEENKSLKKESLNQDYDTKYWRQRYSLKEGIPTFLANIAGMILTTGKYLNVMRECGHSVQYDLMGKLRSIKHYLLLDQGDFLVHFMDIARDELSKKLDEISVEKLQSLLDVALRTTAAAADPCHEDLTCCVERMSLPKSLRALKDLVDSKTLDINDQEVPMGITGLEAFSLSYKVRWPLSIVISWKSLSKYQLIFRFLFHCKHVERQLCWAWQVHQGVRSLNTRGTSISRSSLLCRSMLKFINSLLHYLTFEVLEPNWHVMHNRIQTAKSIDEVIQHHDFFLDKCLRECLLLLPQLLKKVERLKLLCLQYAAATQWLISSSIDVCKSEELSDSLICSEKSKEWKGRTPKGTKLTTSNSAVTESILKFEKEFNSELQSLGPILSKSSQAEPYLTHLAQWILGIEMTNRF